MIEWERDLGIRDLQTEIECSEAACCYSLSGDGLNPRRVVHRGGETPCPNPCKVSPACRRVNATTHVT